MRRKKKKEKKIRIDFTSQNNGAVNNRAMPAEEKLFFFPSPPFEAVIKKIFLFHF